MARYLYSELSSAIQARANCQKSCNFKWLRRHEDWIEHMEKNLLPSGSGIDCGTKVVLEDCHAEKIVLATSYHHMDDTGYYDGWTEHRVTITPSFTGGINLRISGRNRNEIKEYLHEVFYTALCADITLEWYQYHFDGVPNIKWSYVDGQNHYSMQLPDGESTGDLCMLRSSVVNWCEANRQTLKVRES